MLDLLAAVRRRLRWTWTAATLQWAGPAVALVALGLVVTGHLRPWAWPEPAAVAVAVAAVLVVVVVARLVRIPDAMAARSADRGLDSRDALVAALEVGDDTGVFGERVRRRAEAVAAGATARDAVPVPRAGRRMALTTVAGLSALALAWAPNRQDDIRRERAAEQAALEAEADDLRAEADALEERTGAGEAEAALAEELRALADELDDAGSLEEGLQALADAAAEMRAQVPSDLLALKAATTGLDRSLEATPLPGTLGGTAAEQLDALAGSLSELSPDEQAALAERLAELAATQAVGNPTAADALDAAAAALAAGDQAGAQAALGEAAAAQAAAVEAARAGEAAQAAAGAIDAAAADARARTADAGDQLAGGSQGEGQGDGPGEGQGEGQGAGQGQGQGQGQGAGQGQGQGAGQGQGTGAGSGAIGAEGTRTGTGGGQGGPGRPSGGDGTDDQRPTGEERGAGDVLIYDPTYGEGDQLDAGGSGSGRPGETVGRADGATGQGQTRVPLSAAISDYYRRVTEALDRGEVPPSSRELVQAYFDALSGAG